MSILENCIKSPGSWLQQKGQYSDIVLSSRIRLARNINDINFISKMKIEDFIKVKERTITAITNSSFAGIFEFLDISQLSAYEKQILIERHLISKELALSKNGMLGVSENESLSIMINEEDHLRIQCIQSGLELTEAWKNINKLDDELEKNIDYSFSLEYGYLTSCPTNVGTGMRASILVHLPAMVMIKQISKIHKAIEKVGLTIRGYYGEGTESIGNFFQISNQVTLGKTEQEIIEKIEGISKQIVYHEEEARRALYKESRIKLEDNIFRAYGVLTNARIMSSKETMAAMSLVRLGVNLGLITDISINVINNILIFMQPGHLQKIAHSDLNSEKRDYIRAKMIRDLLKN